MHVPARFEALHFDAEAEPAWVDTNRLFTLWMLIPALGLFAEAVWWATVGSTAVWSLKIIGTLALLTIWLGLFGYVWSHPFVDAPRYLEVQANGIEVHIPHWYQCFIPFAAIATIEHRSRYSLVDMVAETFSQYGRVPVRGEHIAIFCNRRVWTKKGMLPAWRKAFRAKLTDPVGFVSLSREQLESWRRVHQSASAA